MNIIVPSYVFKKEYSDPFEKNFQLMSQILNPDRIIVTNNFITK